MNESTHRRRFGIASVRSWFRFSLRSLLIFTVLVAFVVKWWTKPELAEYPQPDGATLRYSLVRRIDPVTKMSSEPRRHGRYELRDKTGHLLVRGEYEGGLPVGTWTVFHSNGRKALRGVATGGERSGTWIAWTVGGDESARVSFQIPNSPRTMSGKFAAPWLAKRVGDGKSRDEQGQLDHGTFTNDFRDGEWVATDTARQVVRRVEYRWGIRHGRTQLVDTAAGTTHELNYLFGYPLPPLKELLPRLERDLNANDGGKQFEALQTVVLLGPLAERILLQVLNGTDSDQQIQALRLIAEEPRTSQNVLHKLQDLTQSEHQEVAVEAWFALYRRSPQRQVELAQQIVDFAARAELPTRYAVEFRLGRQAGSVAGTLAQAVHSDNPTVRRVAVETLAVMMCVAPATELSDKEAESRQDQLNEIVARAEALPDPAIAAALAKIGKAQGKFSP